ncbi:MAG: HNH endonuclease [Bradyrhizobium sp.]|nr:HNH endonuclease [Bradyrhizobium sp.]
MGPLNYAGYGLYGHKPSKVHRLMYELCVGAIPPGLVIDHRCRVRCCGNPQHLEPVTPKINTLRGERPSRQVCTRGHSLADAYVDRRGFRGCVECRRMHSREWKRGQQ